MSIQNPRSSSRHPARTLSQKMAAATFGLLAFVAILNSDFATAAFTFAAPGG